jgi:hypothetical protein
MQSGKDLLYIPRYIIEDRNLLRPSYPQTRTLKSSGLRSESISEASPSIISHWQRRDAPECT